MVVLRLLAPSWIVYVLAQNENVYIVYPTRTECPKTFGDQWFGAADDTPTQLLSSTVLYFCCLGDELKYDG